MPVKPTLKHRRVRACWQCKRQYRPATRRSLWCSETCSRKWRRAQASQWHKDITNICERCGKLFTATRILTRWCGSDCREKTRRKDPKRIEYLRDYNKWRNHNGKDMARRHGVTVEVMTQWLQVGCYYPGGNHAGDLGVDHDHDHCPGRYGCGICSRGLLCARHNTALGGIERDLDFTMWVLQQPMLQNKIRREA